MLSTIDSKPQLFSFLGEIRKAQSFAQKTETFLDDYIQNLDRFPDLERTKGTWAIRLGMEDLKAQNDYLIEVYPGDLPDSYFQSLKALKKSGAGILGDQFPANAYLSLDDALLCSNHLQGVHKALRALVHYLETECELQRAEPTPTAPIVSPTAQAPATESADPKPTESEPKEREPLDPNREIEGKRWKFQGGAVDLSPCLVGPLKAYLGGESFFRFKDGEDPYRYGTELGKLIRKAETLGFIPHKERWPRGDKKGAKIWFDKPEGKNNRNSGKLKKPGKTR